MADQFPSSEQARLIANAAQGRSALIISGPGSGKSRTALEIARQTVRSFPSENFQEVLFLSFSNAAINRLAASAGIHFVSVDKYRLRFMTFHSCAAELLSRYGRFVGLPPRGRVTDKLEERLIAIDSGWAENDPGYDSNLMSLAKSDGILTFDTLLPLAISLLRGSTTLRNILARRYPLIMVDEFQDTSEKQWLFLQQLGAAVQVIALGDPNQIIYSSLHSATERRLEEFAAWKGVQADRSLTCNHRCSQAKILEFAGCLLTASRFDIRNSGPVKFGKMYRNQLRAELALLWKRIQEKIGGGQTIGILLPSNKLVEDVAAGLRNPPAGSGVHFPVYARVARDDAAYDAVMLAIGACRDYAESPTEITARKAALALLAMNASWDSRATTTKARLDEIAVELLKNKAGDATSIGQFLSSSLREDLAKAVSKLVDALAELRAFKRCARRIDAHPAITRWHIRRVDEQLPMFDDLRAHRIPKGLCGYESFEGKTHVLTYNKAKSREFDYVVMVVDPREESGKTPIDEKRRLYYVTATRARKWLGVIYFGNELGPVLGPVLHG